MPKAQSGNGTNGNGHGTTKNGGLFRALGSVLLDRYKWARSMGMTFGGARDVWGKLGYPENLTVSQYIERYERGGIAARIIDTMPKATWRGDMWLEENDNPDNVTQFERSWDDLNDQLKVTAVLERVDKLSRLSNYAVLLIGAEGSLDTELPKGKPGKLLYLQAYLGAGGPTVAGNSVRVVGDEADATIVELELDTESPRFGLPKTYQLKRTDVSSPSFQKPVHWSRIIHVAEGCLRDDVYGQPALQRVWNYLEDLDKVVGGGSESFWLRANQGLHLDIDKDMELEDVQSTLENLKTQSEEYKHQLTRWLRTRGVSVETLGSDVANFSNPMDAIVTLIAGATGIPKRILVGSEMGELASSQDRENFKDLVNGRQSGYAGPYIVRPFVDRLIAYGYLPTPKQYDVKWPHVEVLTEAEKWAGAQAWAAVNQTQGSPVFKAAEIRDRFYGLQPLTPEDIQAEADEKQAATPPPPEPPAQPAAAQPAPADGTVPTPEEALVAAQDTELIRVLEAAIETGATDVVHAILGLPIMSGELLTTVTDLPTPQVVDQRTYDYRTYDNRTLVDPRTLGGPSSGNHGHAGRPGAVGGSAPKGGSASLEDRLTARGFHFLKADYLPAAVVNSIDPNAPHLKPMTGDLSPAAVDGIEEGLTLLEQQQPGLARLVKDQVQFVLCEYDPEVATATTVTGPEGAFMLMNTNPKANPLNVANKRFTIAQTMATEKGLTGDAFLKETYKGILTHEVGHIANDVMGGGVANALVDSLILTGHGDSTQSIVSFLKDNLSEYAALGGPHEAAAEAFASVVMGRPLPRELAMVETGIRHIAKLPYKGER